MDAKSVESEVLRRFYGDIHEVIVHPRKVASLLFQEGVVSEEVVDKALVSAEPYSEKNAAIMRAVSAAVKADPKNLQVFIAVLEKSPESAPMANKMRDALQRYELKGEKWR